MTGLTFIDLAGAAAWLSDFGAVLACGDATTAAALFLPDVHWRDLVPFTLPEPAPLS